MLALEAKPYINSNNELVVPFSCDPRYHYWRRGKKHLTLKQILEELNADTSVKQKYIKPEE